MTRVNLSPFTKDYRGSSSPQVLGLVHLTINFLIFEGTDGAEPARANINYYCVNYIAFLMIHFSKIIHDFCFFKTSLTKLPDDKLTARTRDR